MSDTTASDNSTPETNNTNSATEQKTLSLPVVEYNNLMAKNQKYEQDIAYLQKQIQDLNGQVNKPKPVAKDEDAIKKQFQEQIESLAKENALVKQNLRAKTITSELAPKLAKVFVPDAQTWVMKEVLSEIDLDGDDIHTPKFLIKDVSGNVRWSKQKPAERLGLDEYLDELKERFPSFVATNFKRGEGSEANKQVSTHETELSITDIQNMSDEELRKIALDPEKQKGLTRLLKLN